MDMASMHIMVGCAEIVKINILDLRKKRQWVKSGYTSLGWRR